MPLMLHETQETFGPGESLIAGWGRPEAPGEPADLRFLLLDETPGGGLRITAREGREINNLGGRRLGLLSSLRSLSAALEDAYRGANPHQVAKDRLYAGYRQSAHSARLPIIGFQLNRHDTGPYTRVTVDDLNPVDMIVVSDTPIYRRTHLHLEFLCTALAWHDELGESGMTYQRLTI